MRVARKVLRFIFIFVLLLGTWLLLSGKFDAFHVGWGVAGSLVIGVLTNRWLRDRPFPLLGLLLFIPWHLWQILLSNLRLARLVLTPGLPIKPRLLRRSPGSSDNRALTLLGCAITLTPGTLTVDINDRYMIVHAVDDGSYEDMRNNVMADRVAAVFRGVSP